MALNFGAADDYLTNARFPASGGSISFWLRPNWNSGDGVAHFFIAGEGSGNFFQALKYSDDNCYFGLWQGAAETRVVFADTGIFSAGAWVHILITWINGGTTTGYINGAAKGTQGSTPTFTLDNGFLVGSRAGLTGADAAMAEIGIWNVALTANEALALSRGARCREVRRAAITGWWPLDGIETNEPDFSGNGVSLIPSGSPTPANGPPMRLFTRVVPAIFAGGGANNFTQSCTVASSPVATSKRAIAKVAPQASAAAVASLAHPLARSFATSTAPVASAVSSSAQRVTAQASSHPVATRTTARGFKIQGLAQFAASLFRSTGKVAQAQIGQSPWSPDFSDDFGPRVATLVVAKAGRVVAAQASTMPVASNLKRTGRSAQLSPGPVISASKTVNKPLIAAMPGAASFSFIFNRTLQSIMAPVVSGGAHVIFKLANAVDNAAASLTTVKSKLASASASTALVASLAKSSPRTFATINAATTVLARQNAKLAAGSTAPAASNVRSTTKARFGTQSASVAALSAIKVRLLSAQALTAPVASLARRTSHFAQSLAAPIAALTTNFAIRVTAQASANMVALLARTTFKASQAINAASTFYTFRVVNKGLQGQSAPVSRLDIAGRTNITAQAQSAPTASLLRSTEKQASASSAPVLSLGKVTAAIRRSITAPVTVMRAGITRFVSALASTAPGASRIAQTLKAARALATPIASLVTAPNILVRLGRIVARARRRLLIARRKKER
jgi:hypothetical protein